LSTLSIGGSAPAKYDSLMSISPLPQASSGTGYRTVWQSGTLAPDLEAFRTCQEFTVEQLAHWLGVDLEHLQLLGWAVRPHPADRTFHLQCNALGQRTGCDPFALRTLVKWVHGIG
jgi:hypothetical protein